MTKFILGPLLIKYNNQFWLRNIKHQSTGLYSSSLSSFERYSVGVFPDMALSNISAICVASSASLGLSSVIRL
jgi:hypothetical protein